MMMLYLCILNIIIVCDIQIELIKHMRNEKNYYGHGRVVDGEYWIKKWLRLRHH